MSNEGGQLLGAGWLVQGAVVLSRWLGVSELLIGLTIVAGGTPETGPGQSPPGIPIARLSWPPHKAFDQAKRTSRESS